MLLIAALLSGAPAGAYLGSFSEEFAANQHSTDFRGAGADLIKLGIAPQTADRILVGIANPAQCLDRLASHPGRFFSGIKNGPGGILAQRSRMIGDIAGTADGINVGAGGLPGRIHVGDLALHQLEFANRLTEMRATTDEQIRLIDKQQGTNLYASYRTAIEVTCSWG